MNYKIAFYLTACILIIVCIIWWKTTPGTSPEPKPPIPAIKLSDRLWGNSATLATGVNSITGKTVVVNTLTGEEVEPCEGGSFIGTVEKTYPDINQDITKNNNTEDSDCSINAGELDSNVRAAIEASNKITKGTVIKDGKEVSALFTVIVSAVWERSICTTIQNGGNQYTICLKETDFCEQMYQNRFNAAKWLAENIGPPMSDEEIQQNVLENLPDDCTDIINNN